MANLNDLFNLPTKDDDVTTLVPQSSVSDVRTDLDKDFDDARSNLTEIAAISKAAMEDMARIAKLMQQPRGYDSLAKLIASSILANKALMEIHKHKQDVIAPPPGPSVTNNTLILTTAELQQKLAQIRDAGMKELGDES